MQTIEGILDEIKKRNLNVSQIARAIGIPVQRFHKWVQGENKPKTDDADKLRAWAGKNLEKDISDRVVSLAHEDPVQYGKEKPLSDQIIFNLSESNRVLAESNRTLAEANKVLASNTTLLTSKYTTMPVSVEQENASDVLATVQALQEYTVQISAQVKKISVEKASAELGTMMVAKRKALGKKGTRAGGGK